MFPEVGLSASCMCMCKVLCDTKLSDQKIAKHHDARSSRAITMPGYKERECSSHPRPARTHKTYRLGKRSLLAVASSLWERVH
jgi:hypothetical protein